MYHVYACSRLTFKGRDYEAGETIIKTKDEWYAKYAAKNMQDGGYSVAWQWID